MLKESRMLHAHGELYPHHYSSLLKYSNLLKAKRLSHDATHKKSIDRLQLEKDQEPISESPNSLPKLEVLEYYQIVNPKEKDTSSNTKRVEHQQLQPLKSLQQHEAVKKESGNLKPDLTLKTANLYRSYLKYSSTNPFECNYDVVNKKKNAELLSDSTYRFNRATSSLSILSHSIEFKKFSAASAQANFITTTDNTSQNPVPLEFTSSSTGRIMIRQPPNHNSSSRLNNESSLMESKSSGAGRMAQPSESAGHRKNSARNKPSNATTTNNQFLNYRNEEYLINGSSQNGKKSKEVNSRLDNSGSRLKSAVNKENQVTENIVEQTTSRNKGPENYLESSKLEHIRKWVTEVNRVQAKSGKWGETINKILFYD